jgi:hypothetical protein
LTTRRDNADISCDPAQRFRHLDHVCLAGGVVVFHDGDAAALEPGVELGRPRAFALAFGICRRNKPKGCRQAERVDYLLQLAGQCRSQRHGHILLPGSDHGPDIERRPDQLGQAIWNPWSLRRTFDPPAILRVKLRELLGRGLFDTEAPYCRKPPPSPIRRWEGEPIPELEYAVPDRFPLENVGLFSGEGGQPDAQYRARHGGR